MSSQREIIDEKYTLEYWDNFSDNTKNFLTARQIITYVTVIAIIIQSIGYFLTPNEFLIWNVLTFIVATNLGAVLLAIQAQRTAEQIRDMYYEAFDGDFYHTLYILSSFKNSLIEAGKKEGNDIEKEISELSEDLYGVFKGYLKAFNEHQFKDIELIENKEFDNVNEDELFN